MIPSKVRVSGIEYSVEHKDLIEINGNRNYQGACRYDESKIEIMNGLSETKKEQVFTHELVHAIFNEAGFDEQEEDTVNRLGIVLHQVLKDNKIYFGGERKEIYAGGIPNPINIKVNEGTNIQKIAHDLSELSRATSVKR
ncbi:MAG: hypothetical protein K0S80_3914 [Neobacillus sp.]|nr:hypothetical protein [Neobacillus sp.]